MLPLQLTHKVHGSGTKSIMAFHGFGQDASSWRELSDRLGESYRIIAIEAPFHGEQVSIDKIEYQKAITPQELADAVQQIAISENAIESSFVAYSLGARILLNYLTFYPATNGQILLLAPDGLKPLTWRKFATQTLIGRLLFRRTMKHPGWILMIVRFLAVVHFIPSSINKFVSMQLKPLSNRRRLYATWTALRAINPKTIDIIKHQISLKIPVHLIMGSRDTIIQPKSATKLIRNCPEINYTEIEAGHFILNENGLNTICKVLNQPANTNMPSL